MFLPSINCSEFIESLTKWIQSINEMGYSFRYIFSFRQYNLIKQTKVNCWNECMEWKQLMEWSWCSKPKQWLHSMKIKFELDWLNGWRNSFANWMQWVIAVAIPSFFIHFTLFYQSIPFPFILEATRCEEGRMNWEMDCGAPTEINEEEN